ncbi:hypothetical protein [Marinovum sp.]|uniref:hypothetical protein n=1 Tax=Marinovum sp. TaxID=2024839 RepID=UPI002B270198|nr:hypothetical protein [Marinovum sp.]
MPHPKHGADIAAAAVLTEGSALDETAIQRFGGVRKPCWSTSPGEGSAYIPPFFGGGRPCFTTMLAVFSTRSMGSIRPR